MITSTNHESRSRVRITIDDLDLENENENENENDLTHGGATRAAALNRARDLDRAHARDRLPHRPPVLTQGCQYDPLQRSPMKPASRPCPWPKTPLDLAYHDTEWGVPLHDDRAWFELLILEGAQAGLSWSTILNKRENYRRAFDQFDVEKIARYDARKSAKLLADPGIVRNRLKIAATIQNAKAFIEVQREFGSFDRYVWRFVGGKPIVNRRRHRGNVPARTPESDALSRDLLKRGFKFVGSTICYAFMQAGGLVNDHLITCPRHSACGT